MKKKLLTAISSVLLCSLVLSATGCTSKDTADITPAYTGKTATTVNEMFKSSIDRRYNVLSVDGAGVAVVEKKTGTVEITTEYSLFDVKTNTFISNATSENPITKIADGFYYSISENEDGEEEYTLFMNGEASPKMQGDVDTTNGVFYAKDNTRFYINANGKAASESDPFKSILTQTMIETGSVNKIGDYYFDFIGESAVALFDNSGKHLKNIDWKYTLGLQENEEVHAYWSVGGNVFFQTSYELPVDATKYDLFLSDESEVGAKLDINTYYYILEDDKVKTVDTFGYYVEDVYDEVNESALLSVCPIENARMGSEIMQAFGDDGSITVDIQELAPGATNVLLRNGYVVFYTNAGYVYVYQGEELIDQYYETAYRRYLNNVSYCQIGSVLYIYSLEGKEIAKYTDIENVSTTAEGNLYFGGDNKVYVYNTTSKKLTMTTTLEETSMNFNINPFFLQAANGNIEQPDKYGKVSMQYLVGEHATLSGLESASFITNSYGDGCVYAIFATVKKNTDGEYITTFRSIYSTYAYVE